MKALNQIIAAGTLALAATGAQASPIVGFISFDLTGTYLDAGGSETSINDATQVTFDDNDGLGELEVTVATGVFANIADGAFGFFDDFIFNPIDASTPITPLWSVADVGGVVFSFDLISIDEVFQPGNNTLSIFGSGTIFENGVETFDANWSFGTTDPSGGFEFTINSDSSTVAVPEPAMLGLLGLGMAGIGLAASRRRKLAA